MTKTVTGNTRDRRRIATGRGTSDFEYNPLPNHDWTLIQQKIGSKFSPKLKKQLSGITMIYAAATIPRPTRSLSEIIKEIELWRGHTEALRTKIWSNIPTKITGPSQTLKQISETYFHPHQNLMTKNYPLGQMARFLEGSIAISNYFLAILKDQNFKNERKTELWLIWAAFVIALCRESGIEVKKPSRKDLLPGFILLLDKLQGTIAAPTKPAAQKDTDGKLRRKNPQRHVPSSIGIATKKRSSLNKNAMRAFAIAEENPTADLFVLLTVWGLGLSQVGADAQLTPKEMKPVLERLTAQMKVISPKRIDLTGYRLKDR